MAGHQTPDKVVQSADVHVTKRENIHISPSPIVNTGRIFKETLSVARSGLFSSVIICGTAQRGLPRQEDLTYGRRIERVGSELMTQKSHVLGRIRGQLPGPGPYSSATTETMSAPSTPIPLPSCRCATC